MRLFKRMALTMAIAALFSAAGPSFLSAQELSGGEVWTRNCNRCHEYRPIKERTDRGWKIIMQHMRVRANLSGKEARAALEFLQQLN